VVASFALRPLSVGELLDAAFRLARHLLPVLITLQLLSAAVPLMLGLYNAANGTSALASLTLVNIVGVLVNIVFASLAAGAASLVISEAYLGRTLSAAEALQRAIPRVGPMLVASMVTGLVLVVCLLPFFAVVTFVAVSVGNGTQGVGPARVLAILAGVALLALPVYVLAGFTLQSICAVLEPELDGIGAARRSWALTKGYRRRIFMVMLALGAIFLAVAAGIGAAVAITGLTTGSVAANIVAVIIQAVTSAIVFPIIYSVLTLQYYDLRVRKEGFDLEMLAAALPGAAVTP
jgi:hypothetical protein